MSYTLSRAQTSSGIRSQPYCARKEGDSKNNNITQPMSLTSSMVLEHQPSSFKKFTWFASHQRSKSLDKIPIQRKQIPESDVHIRVTMTATEKYYLNVINSQKIEIENLKTEIETKNLDIEKLIKENQELKLQNSQLKARKFAADSPIYSKNPSFSQKIGRFNRKL
ncbi:unnamed protein product [Blepharisma stoltei]|uniref:Uncharacterized protein n=1 Tax=Blepharisma stoltei TaxID=1481888 RepID=A0AAU9IHH5_9CILI|nr:unnamed protein product [Blepharisma stoltei]